MSGGASWREKLAAWLRTNRPTIPEDLRRLREEFVWRFPKEKLGEMTLDQYAVGRGDRDNFSYWLEYGTVDLGSIGGGSAAKAGVWWSKSKNSWQWNEKIYRSAEDALSRIRDGLVELVKATEEGRFDELDEIGQRHLGSVWYLRSKPLWLYFPEQFLPMWHPEHIANFLRIFGAEARGEVLARNRQLLQLLHSLPEFEGFDTFGLMRFLYDSYPQKKVVPKVDADGTPEPEPETPRGAVPPELARLIDFTERPRTRNVLLYGPPGTGKTWVVNHFTNYFLLRHNVSEEAAGAYWAAVARKDTAAARALQSQVRAAEGAAGAQPNFWWMVANEEEWSWKILFEKGEWVFGKRKVAENFENAKPGDFIFGYLARPHMKVVALARVEKGLETRLLADGTEKEGVTIKPLAWLPHPLGWREIKANPLLENSEPVRRNTHGAMFRLTAEEAHELASMLNAAGNDVRLPAGARGDFAEFVTFHQSFAYEEFVEGLKPVAAEEAEGEEASGAAGEIKYRVEPGVFRRVCARAEAAWRAHGGAAPRYLLVIDEINRANIAKVLGELITLVEDDKRLGEANEVLARLPYSGERFGVPPNLYILGTMNTADRSIALLDLALRRRFAFVEMMPDASLLEAASAAVGVDLRALLERLNERVAALLDPDHQIGHSYFLHVRDADDLAFAWYARILPLLQEYFYNDTERLRAVVGGRFIEPVKVSPETAKALGGLYEHEQAGGRVVKLSGDEFLSALRRLAGGDAEAPGVPEGDPTPQGDV